MTNKKVWDDMQQLFVNWSRNQHAQIVSVSIKPGWSHILRNPVKALTLTARGAMIHL